MGGLRAVLGSSDGGDPSFQVEQLVSLRDVDVFPPSGFVSMFHQEFILMDVVLNRTFTPIDVLSVGRGEAVVPVRSRDVNRLAPEADGEFRTVIAIIPSSGHFYVARERHEAGRVEEERRSLVPHDISWLRLTSNGEFGEGGYVKRLHDSGVGSISAWRVSLDLSIGSSPTRLIRAARQLSDEHGPALPPDVFDGECCDWSPDARAVIFNTRLAESNSARDGGGHYARGCHHFHIPTTCCVVDPTVTPVVDFIVELADSCGLKSRKTSILIRNVLSSLDRESDALLNEALDQINVHNALVAGARSVGGARNSRGDFGVMHPIGTRIHLDGVGVGAYAANSLVPELVLREFVRSLSIVGRHCFPDVLTMIQELEADSGLTPVPPMNGDGRFGRVGYSIDMSVDLANASHYDVGDASPGFSVWTETIPGAAGNWFFVMPNVVGVDEAGREFYGLAVKLAHGVAISWDGRVLRHCTSLCEPNANANGAQNRLFGSFSAAKYSILKAGTMR